MLVATRRGNLSLSVLVAEGAVDVLARVLEHVQRDRGNVSLLGLAAMTCWVSWMMLLRR